MECRLKRVDEGQDGKIRYQCQACKRFRESTFPPERLHFRCKVGGLAEPAPPLEGPGTELKKLLASVGIKPGGCECDGRAELMNRNGVQWCRDNLDTIVGWLREAAHKRGLPFVDAIGRLLVKKAIRRAERIAPATTNLA